MTLGLAMGFLIQHQKHDRLKKKIGKVDFINIRNLAACNVLLREGKNKPQTGRKYFQNTYQIKDLCPKYIKLNNQKTQ